MPSLLEQAARGTGRGVQVYAPPPLPRYAPRQVAPTRRTTMPPGQGGSYLDQMLTRFTPAEQVEEQEQGPGGWKGALGSVMTNPLGQAVLRPLDIIDRARRGMTIGLEAVAPSMPVLREIIDTDREDDRSYWEKFNDPNYGFGQIVEKTGNQWLDRTIGFAGDVALDPTTYLTAGVGGVAGRAGRAGLAGKAVLEGMSEEAVQRLGRFGATRLTAEELTEYGAKLGLKDKHAIRFGIGKNRVAIPGTERISRGVSRVTSGARAAIGDMPGMSRLREWRYPKGLEAEMERLMTGKVNPNNPMSARSAAAKVAFNNTFRLEAREFHRIFAQEAENLQRQVGQTGGPAATHALESGAETPWRDFFEKVRTAADEAGVNVNKRDNYAPHVWTPEARAWLNGGSADAKAFRKEFGISVEELDNPSGVTLQRRIVPSEKPYIINGREVHIKDGSIKGINDALRTMFPNAEIKFLEDDIRTITSQYLRRLSDDVGTVKAGKVLADRSGGLMRNEGDKAMLREVLDEVETKVANETAAKELSASWKKLHGAARAIEADTKKGVGAITGILKQPLIDAIDELTTVRAPIKRKLDALMRNETVLNRDRTKIVKAFDDELKELDARIAAHNQRSQELARDLGPEIEAWEQVRPEAAAARAGPRQNARRKMKRAIDAETAALQADRETLQAVRDRIEAIDPEVKIPQRKAEIYQRHVGDESFARLLGGEPQTREVPKYEARVRQDPKILQEAEAQLEMLRQQMERAQQAQPEMTWGKERYGPSQYEAARNAWEQQRRRVEQLKRGTPMPKALPYGAAGPPHVPVEGEVPWYFGRSEKAIEEEYARRLTELENTPVRVKPSAEVMREAQDRAQSALTEVTQKQMKWASREQALEKELARAQAGPGVYSMSNREAIEVAEGNLKVAEIRRSFATGSELAQTQKGLDDARAALEQARAAERITDPATLKGRRTKAKKIVDAYENRATNPAGRSITSQQYNDAVNEVEQITRVMDNMANPPRPIRQIEEDLATTREIREELQKEWDRRQNELAASRRSPRDLLDQKRRSLAAQRDDAIKRARQRVRDADYRPQFVNKGWGGEVQAGRTRLRSRAEIKADMAASARENNTLAGWTPPQVVETKSGVPAKTKRNQRAIAINDALTKSKTTTTGSNAPLARADKASEDALRARQAADDLIQAGAVGQDFADRIDNLRINVDAARAEYAKYPSAFTRERLAALTSDLRRYAEFTLRYDAAIKAGLEPSEGAATYVTRQVIGQERRAVQAEMDALRGGSRQVIDHEADQMTELMQTMIEDISQADNDARWAKNLLEMKELPPAERVAHLRERLAFNQEWQAERRRKLRNLKRRRDYAAANPESKGKAGLRQFTPEEQARNVLKREEGRRSKAATLRALRSGEMELPEILHSEQLVGMANLPLIDVLRAMPEEGGRVWAERIMREARLRPNIQIKSMRSSQKKRLLELLGLPTEIPERYSAERLASIAEYEGRAEQLHRKAMRLENEINAVDNAMAAMQEELDTTLAGGLDQELRDALPLVKKSYTEELIPEEVERVQRALGPEMAGMFDTNAFLRRIGYFSDDKAAEKALREELGTDFTDRIADIEDLPSGRTTPAGEELKTVTDAATLQARDKQSESLRMFGDAFRALGFRQGEDVGKATSLGFRRSREQLDMDALREAVQTKLARDRGEAGLGDVEARRATMRKIVNEQIKKNAIETGRDITKPAVRRKMQQELDAAVRAALDGERLARQTKQRQSELRNRFNRLDTMERALGKQRRNPAAVGELPAEYERKIPMPRNATAEQRAAIKAENEAISARNKMAAYREDLRAQRIAAREEMTPGGGEQVNLDWEVALGLGTPSPGVGERPGAMTGSVARGGPATAERKFRDELARLAENEQFIRDRGAELGDEAGEAMERQQNLATMLPGIENDIFEREMTRAQMIDDLETNQSGSLTPDIDREIQNVKDQISAPAKESLALNQHMLEREEAVSDQLRNIDETLATGRDAILHYSTLDRFEHARILELQADLKKVSAKYPKKRPEADRYLYDLGNIARQRLAADSPELQMTEKLLADAAERNARVAELDLSANETIEVLKKARKGEYTTVTKNVVNDYYEPFAEQLTKEGQGLFVSQELAPRLRNLHVEMQTGRVWKAVEAYTNFFKTYATATPGFHIRNAISAAFMNATDGVTLRDNLRAIRMWGDFRKDPSGFMARLPKGAEGDKIRAAFKATFGSGAGGQFAERGVGVGNKLYDNAYTRLSKRAGEWVEGPARLAMALNTMDNGGDAMTALDRISRIHFDYDQVSRFDEKAKRMVPFWTFMSRNLPMQLSQMWTKPKVYQRYNSLVRNFRGDDEEFVPKYWTEQGAFPTGLTIGGDPMYLAPDLPHTRVNEDIERLGDPMRLAAQLNPLFRVPLETMLAKRKLYTDQPFEEQGYEKLDAELALLGPLFSLIGQTDQGASGPVVTDRAAYAARQLIPPMQLFSRLFPSEGDEFNENRQAQTWARLFGIPAYQLNEQAQAGEVRRQQGVREAQLEKMRALAAS